MIIYHVTSDLSDMHVHHFENYLVHMIKKRPVNVRVADTIWA